MNQDAVSTEAVASIQTEVNGLFWTEFPPV